MASSSVTDTMKNTLLNRGFKTNPDFTAYVSGAIGTSETSATAGDTALGSVIAGWNGGDDFAGFEDGFPALSEPDKTASTRTFVTSLQANGNSITEYADFNGDGSPRIGGRFVFTGITKNKSIQVFFKPVYRFI